MDDGLADAQRLSTPDAAPSGEAMAGRGSGSRADDHPQWSVPQTISDLVAARARAQPDAPAILAPDRAGLTYGDLTGHLDATTRALTALGVDREDRIAVVLPGGPELATALLAFSAVTTVAPLHPDFTAAEFAGYFERLGATAVLFQSGDATAAREPARAGGLRVIELEPLVDDGAGRFVLHAEAVAPSGGGGRDALPGDVALLLTTSGTTARPKVVPLTHRNVCTAALNIQSVLRLNATDCCLNVMPLFHIHGLSALLSTLFSGGRVV
jgi:acyl-CoA synthetase (AMP-forming)/AMP-acid ligase II